MRKDRTIKFVADCKEILMKTDPQFRSAIEFYEETGYMSDAAFRYCREAAHKKNEEIRYLAEHYSDEDF